MSCELQKKSYPPDPHIVISIGLWSEIKTVWYLVWVICKVNLASVRHTMRFWHTTDLHLKSMGRRELILHLAPGHPPSASRLNPWQFTCGLKWKFTQHCHASNLYVRVENFNLWRSIMSCRSGTANPLGKLCWCRLFLCVSRAKQLMLLKALQQMNWTS